MPPPVHYARSGEVRIAYQVVGDGPLDLLWNHSIVGNLDLFWENPAFERQVRNLSSFTRLILLNERGVGISDRPAPLEAFEERMDDLRAVMDAVGTQRAHILATSNAGSIGCLFAAAHPERVRSLILWGASTRILRAPDYPWGEDPQAFDQRLESIERDGFEPSDPGEDAARGSVWAGPVTGRDPTFWEWWGRVLRATGPAAFVAWLRTQRDIDVRPILGSIRVPTLIMQGVDDPGWPVESGMAFAAAIPGARFEAIPGIGHLWNDAWPTVFGIIREWITGRAAEVPTDRFLTSLAFLDIASSTERIREIGDPAWRSLLDRYFHIARRELAVCGGHEIDTAGDSLFARFDGPARAIQCCQAIQGEAKSLGLSIRAGVHTGEVEKDNGAVRGINVAIAARIAAKAAGGQLLVSSTVRDLAIGCGARFGDLGMHELKGVEGRRQIFEVT